MIDTYLQLVNHDLPQAAQADRTYPVRFNHCFARIILDNLCGRPWREVIKAPAYKHLSPEQMQGAIELGQRYLVDPALCVEHNCNSLRYRGKL